MLHVTAKMCFLRMPLGMPPPVATWDAPPVAKEGDCLQLLVSAKCANLIIVIVRMDDYRDDDDDEDGDNDGDDDDDDDDTLLSFSVAMAGETTGLPKNGEVCTNSNQAGDPSPRSPRDDGDDGDPGDRGDGMVMIARLN